MKNTVLLFLFLIICKHGFCQIWQKDAQLFSIGVGESAVYNEQVDNEIQASKRKAQGNYGSFKIQSTPAIFGKFEHAFSKRIGVGFVVAYRKTVIDQSIPYSYYDTNVTIQTAWGNVHPLIQTTDRIKYTTNDVSFGARLNIHLLDHKRFDPYIGIGAGYRLIERSLDKSLTNPDHVYIVEYNDPIPLYLSATAGLRYFLSNKFGFYAELGFDKWSVIQGGITFKL